MDEIWLSGRLSLHARGVAIREQLLRSRVGCFRVQAVLLPGYMASQDPARREAGWMAGLQETVSAGIDMATDMATDITGRMGCFLETLAGGAGMRPRRPHRVSASNSRGRGAASVRTES